MNISPEILNFLSFIIGVLSTILVIGYRTGVKLSGFITKDEFERTFPRDGKGGFVRYAEVIEIFEKFSQSIVNRLDRLEARIDTLIDERKSHANEKNS